MPDATEWLVEYVDAETADPSYRYEHIEERDNAIEYLRQLAGQGKTAILYERVPFTVQTEVTVHWAKPRRRRKNSPPADKPGSDTPTGPGNGAAGEPKEGAASAHAEQASVEGVGAPVPPPVLTPASNLASPVFPWTCEARFDDGPECPGRAEFDPATRGRFCSLHLTEIGLSGRMELHRRNHARNRPVRVAHAG